MSTTVAVIRPGASPIIKFGENAGAAAISASRARDAAEDAEAAAVIAQAVNGPLYNTIALGLAGTVDGEEFAVDNGDGTAGIYLNDDGSEVLTRTIIIDPSNGGTAGFLGIKRAEIGAVTRNMAAVAQERCISVKDFGAQGDNSTDDTAAITSALAAVKAEGGGRLIFPQGIYRHSGLSVEDLRFVTIEGVARGAFGSAGNAGVRLVCTSATADHIALLNPHGVRITQLQLETFSSITPTAGAVIELIGTNGSAASCDIDHVRIEKHFNGVVIDGVSNSEFEHSQVRNGLGTFAVKLIGTSKRLDQIRLKSIITDTEVSGGSATQNGFEFGTDIHTVWIEDCSALQARVGYVMDGAIAPEFLYFQASEAENCNSHGFLVDRADHLRMAEAYATVNNGSGIVFGGTFNSTARLIAPCARGNINHGILIDGSGGIEIIAPRIGGNSVGTPGSSHGIRVGANDGNFSVIGGKVGGDVNLQGTGSQAFGISIAAGTSNNYRIIGVDLQGNTTGALDDGGTGSNKVVQGNFGVNNLAAAAVTVGASPFTYTNTTGSNIALSVTGGTVSSITVGGDQVAAATNEQVIVPAGGSAVITYSALPAVKAKRL